MKEEAHLPFYTTSLSFFFLFSPFLLSLSPFKTQFTSSFKTHSSLSLSLFFLVPYIQPGIGFWQFRASFGFWLQLLVSAALVSFPLSFCLGGSEFEFKTKTQQDNFSETMIGNFIDEIDCGSFFDTIDDLLDFPNDDVESGLGSAPDCNAAFNNNSLWPNQSGSLPAPNDAVFSAGNSASDLSAELSVPIEDIVQLEWLSNFVEDSFSGGSLTINKPDSFINKDTSHHQFQTSSPISVLDSSSSCSGDKNVPQSPGPVAAPGKRGRARSKRPRPATFNPRPAIQLISPASSVTEAEGPQAQPFLAPKVPSDSENFAESRPVIKIPKQASGELKKKKKLKVSLPLAPLEGNQNSGPTQAAVRKCLHCEITKTPQWRAGPMGPKTLCNACGVRYKSGRLFPEYRPAASPTFVPSLHSNSHKKVLEMRTKGGELVVFGETATAMNETPELIPNTNSSISMDYM